MLLPIPTKLFVWFCRFPPNVLCQFAVFHQILQCGVTKISCELLHRFAITLPFGVPVRVIGIRCAECACISKIKGGKMFKSLREFTQFSLRFYSNLLRLLLKSRCGYAMIIGCIVRPKYRRISAERQLKERYIRAASVRLPLVFGSRGIG